VKLADVFEAPPGPPLLLVRLQRCGTFCEQFVKLAHHLGRYQRLHLMEAFEAEFHESLGFLGHVLDWVELLSQSLAESLRVGQHWCCSDPCRCCPALHRRRQTTKCICFLRGNGLTQNAWDMLWLALVEVALLAECCICVIFLDEPAPSVFLSGEYSRLDDVVDLRPAPMYRSTRVLLGASSQDLKDVVELAPSFDSLLVRSALRIVRGSAAYLDEHVRDLRSSSSWYYPPSIHLCGGISDIVFSKSGRTSEEEVRKHIFCTCTFIIL